MEDNDKYDDNNKDANDNIKKIKDIGLMMMTMSTRTTKWRTTTSRMTTTRTTMMKMVSQLRD